MTTGSSVVLLLLCTVSVLAQDNSMACGTGQPAVVLSDSGTLTLGEMGTYLPATEFACSWGIIVKKTPPTDYVVQLSVTWLAVGDPGSPPDCSASYLRFEDGGPGGSVLTSLCEPTKTGPVVIRSTKPGVAVVFHLNSLSNDFGAGFSLDYGVVPKNAPLPTPDPTPTPTPDPTPPPPSTNTTASSTASSTASATATPSSTPTPTGTASASSTPIPIIIGSSSPTSSVTATASASASATASASMLPSAQHSSLPTASGSATGSATASASPSAALPSSSSSPVPPGASPTSSPTSSGSASSTSSPVPSSSPLVPASSLPPSPTNSPWPSQTRYPPATSALPPPPPSVHNTASVVLRMTSTPWHTGSPDAFLARTVSDVSAALNLPPVQISVGLPSSSSSFDVSLQLLPPPVGTDPAMYTSVLALHRQLADPTSALRTSSTGSLLASANPVSLTYTRPATVALNPMSIDFAVPERNRASVRKTVTVSNAGQADLIVSRVGQLPRSVPYLTITPQTLTVRGGASGTLTLEFDPTLFPTDVSTAFQIMELDHNVPSGVHSARVTFQIGSGGGSNGDPADTGPFYSNSNFLMGVGAGVGALVLAGLFVCWMARVCRRCCGGGGGSGRGGGGSGRPSKLPHGGPKSRPQKSNFSRLETESDGGGGDSESKDGRDGVELTSVRVDGGRRSPTVVSGGGGGRVVSVPLSGGGGGGGGGGGKGGSRGSGSGSGSRPSSSPSASRSGRTSSPARSPPHRPSSSASRASPSLPVLNPKPTLRPEEFDAKWNSLTTCELWGATLHNVPNDDELEALLRPLHVPCLASGQLGGVHKYYFYAEEMSGALFMAEFSITVESKRLSVMVKAPTKDVGESFSSLLKARLQSLTKS